MATTKWQCTKCGYQTTTGGNAPGQMTCKMGGYHVWGKLSRFIKNIVDYIVQTVD